MVIAISKHLLQDSHHAIDFHMNNRFETKYLHAFLVSYDKLLVYKILEEVAILCLR